jgi:chorismate-pyruvate lyase
MNPLAELHALTDLFPEPEPLIARAEHVAAPLMPEPYRRLLAHEHHMTVTVEQCHGAPVDVKVIDRRWVGEHYCRKIILTKQGTDQIVLFGVIRFDFQYVTAAVRDEILSESIPLGRVLIRHNVLRHIDLGALLRVEAGPALARYLQMPAGGVTYGRLATIFCNGRPAVDLLEITSPLT